MEKKTTVIITEGKIIKRKLCVNAGKSSSEKSRNIVLTAENLSKKIKKLRRILARLDI